MANFNDITSGHDLEFIIDENIIRHIIQTFHDSEESLVINNESIFKNYSFINRNYNSRGEETFEGNVEDCIQIFNFQNYEHFYIAFKFLKIESIINLVNDAKTTLENNLDEDDPDPDLEISIAKFESLAALLEISDDISIILRIENSISLVEVVEKIKNNNDDNIYSIYSNFFRIQGVILNINAYTQDFSIFNRVLRRHTGAIFNGLIELQNSSDFDFSINLDNIIQSEEESTNLFGLEKRFNVFLRRLHNELGISDAINNALIRANPFSPFLFNNITFKPFIEENKIGVYCNLNTINLSTRIKLGTETLFATNARSGFGINLTEELIQDVFLSLMRFEMQKLLDQEDITQSRFDSINYSFPFAFPIEIIDLFDLHQATKLFDVKKLKLEFVRHKFANQHIKIDALKLKIRLSNIDQNFFQSVFDMIVPNPLIEIFIGLDNTGSEFKILIDNNINIPYNLFTALITAPLISSLSYTFLINLGSIVPLIPLSPISDISITPPTTSIATSTISTLLPLGLDFFSVFGPRIISNTIINKIIEPDLEFDTPKELVNGLPITKKRWDPFYYTNHNLKLKIQRAFINEKTQIKLLFTPELKKSFEAYKGIWLSDVTFGARNSLRNFTYKLNYIDDVVKATLPATDRIVDLYDNIENLTAEINGRYDNTTINALENRKEKKKLHSSISYSPQFVNMTNLSITQIRILSDYKKTIIKEMLIRRYEDYEIQRFIDMFFQLIQTPIPDFNFQIISEEQLDQLKEEIRILLQNTPGHAYYSNIGYINDLTTYLRENTHEMLTLTPLQIALLGMPVKLETLKQIVGNNLLRVFNFLDLPTYKILVRNGRVTFPDLKHRLRSLPRFN